MIQLKSIKYMKRRSSGCIIQKIWRILEAWGKGGYLSKEVGKTVKLNTIS